MCSIKQLLVLVILASLGSAKRVAIKTKKEGFEDTKDNPVVSIRTGKIRGRQDITVGQRKNYYAFQGIPYAQPPIKKLRFKSPLPANAWLGIKNTMEDSKMCVQISDNFLSTVGDEDCLYINVYTPRLPNSNGNPKLAVMVWIYGGYFFMGDNFYNSLGPDYLLEEDVIFVAMNYRLGIFGFLSTEDEASPGNYGLKDQVLALKWVQQNIAAFGGDPNKVTIAGESAGSSSVAYLAQSSLTRGLYQRAILQSGCTLCPSSYSRNPKKMAFRVGLSLGIVTKNTTRLVDKLRSTDAWHLHSMAMIANLLEFAAEGPFDGFPFAPTIEPQSEDALLLDRSHEILLRQNMNNVTYLMGLTTEEGRLFAKIIPYLRLYMARFDISSINLVRKDMNVNNKKKQLEIAARLKSKYFGVVPIAFTYQRFIKFISDDQFIRPFSETLRLYAQNRKVYFYILSYEGLLGNSVMAKRDSPGVAHGEDLEYLFRVRYHPPTISTSDLITRYRIVKLWTNFVKYGNPTPFPDSFLGNLKWPLTSKTNKYTYFRIDTNFSLGQRPFEDSVQFYDEIYKKYGNPPYDTY